MNARELAWKILVRTIQQEAYAGTLLRQKPADCTQEDYHLAVRIVYGTLSQYRYLEYQWQDLKKGKLPVDIRLLIDMALYQIWFLERIPVYAAIDTAVDLAKQNKHGHYSGVVNAILHNILRRGKKDMPQDRVARLAIQASIPDWLVRLWDAHYGNEETDRLCVMIQKEKPTCFRVKQGYDRQEILGQMPGSRAGRLSPMAVFAGKDPFSCQPYQQGKLAVQDEASQLPAYWLQIETGMRILEMCAAPGTKTVQMAEMLKDEGSTLALDLYPARVSMIRQALNDNDIHCVEAKAYDARQVNEIAPVASFDRIALDAPCSGLGVLRDKPDMRLRISPEKIDELVITQRELLARAREMLKPGGLLVYSTCTLNKKENERQTDWLIKQFPDMMKEEERTVFPEEDDNDGFYICRMKRV